MAAWPFSFNHDFHERRESYSTWKPLSEAERARYHTINEDNLGFLSNRYNRVNRWVIADMLRRSRYRFPDKPALIFGDQTLTYGALEDDCNKVANSLLELGIDAMTG